MDTILHFFLTPTTERPGSHQTTFYKLTSFFPASIRSSLSASSILKALKTADKEKEVRTFFHTTKFVVMHKSRAVM